MLTKDNNFFQGISDFQKDVNQEWVHNSSVVPCDNKYLTIFRYFPDPGMAIELLSKTEEEADLILGFSRDVKDFRDNIKSDADLTSGKSFIKIIFRGLGLEQPEAYFAKDDNSLCAIKKFMEVYESFQRNHRTTLNQALTAYIKRKDIKILLFRARFEKKDNSFDNFFSNFTDSDDKNLHFFVFNIPPTLQVLLLNNVIKAKLKGIDTTIADSDTGFEDALKTGVENCYWSLRHNEKLISLKEYIIKAGNILLLDLEDALEQNEQNNEDLVLREMCRLLLGICVFIEYDGCDDSQLDIYLTTTINKKWIGFLSRLGREINDNNFLDLFSGLYFATEKLAPKDEKQDSTKILTEAISDAINNDVLVTRPENAKNAYWKKFVEMIQKADSDADHKFIKAIAATLKFSTLYRPFSVHEGKEQQLNFVVGFPDEIKSLLAKRIPLKKRNSKKPFVYLPLKINEPKDIIDARSFFKSSCNIFNNKHIAIFVDASSIDTANNRVSCPYVAELEIPVFRYPSARQLCNVIHDKHTALINIYGKSKIDFFYQGQTILHWTDHDFMWAGANCWSVESLTERLSKIVEIKEKIDEYKNLEKIINILFSISRLPREGAAVCFCATDQGLSLDESPNTSHKFVEFVPAMTDKSINKVNFLDNILKIGDKEIENMLTLDGGAIFDIKQGELWARRKFMGKDPNFGPDKKIKVQNGDSEEEQLLSRIWEDTNYEMTPFNSLRWDSWKRYKEWGTRHQQSLSFSALELDKVKLVKGNYIATKYPDFSVVVVSEDGGITLMHNGRVIEPDA